MTTFQPQPIYRLFSLISLIMTVLFAWDLIQGVEAGSVLFFSICLGLLAWTARAAMTKVVVTPQQLNVSPPISRKTEIEFGQILSVSEEGRMVKAIVVTYHPRTSDGLLDLDRANSITLPAVKDQDTLYEELVEKAPV